MARVSTSSGDGGREQIDAVLGAETRRRRRDGIARVERHDVYSIEEPHAEMNDAFVAFVTTRSTDRPTTTTTHRSPTPPSRASREVGMEILRLQTHASIVNRTRPRAISARDETVMGFDIRALFGLAPTPEERARACRSKLRRMQRDIESQIRDIERTAKATEREIKRCAARRDLASCRALAREVVTARSTVSGLYTTRARMRSVEAAVSRRGAAATSARAVERSSEVMRAMSDLMRANGVREDARELSREMARAGMMEEILEETLGETLDADGDEDETERAVEDVLREMVGEVEFPETAVGKAETETVVTETVVTETETETTTEDLKARLDAMRAE